MRPRNPNQTTLIQRTHTHTDVAESIGRELLVYGRRIPKAEMFARIDAVSADTVSLAGWREGGREGWREGCCFVLI